MKFALINPLSKTYHPASPNDARPVALLTELSKLCERLVQQQLMQFIQADNLLSPCQSCYKKGDSTQTALLGVLEDIRWAIERRMVTILALFDFSKAFDCIPHRALLSKLQALGISGTPLTWFYNCLQGRYQAVRIDRARHSEFRPIASGVPQWSVLGPIMFGLYSRDLPSVL